MRLLRLFALIAVGLVSLWFYLSLPNYGGETPESALAAQVKYDTHHYREVHGHWPKVMEDVRKLDPAWEQHDRRREFRWTYSELPNGDLEIHFITKGVIGLGDTQTLHADPLESSK